MYTIATIPHGGYDWTFVNYSKKKKRKKKNMLYYNFIWKKMLYNDVQYRLWKDM